MPKGYSREAFESIPGNETNSPTLSTKKLNPPLQSFGLKLGAKPLSRDDELRNQDEPLPVVSDNYAPTWEYTSRAYPDVTGWRLKHICGTPTTTTGNGVITDPDGVVIPTGAFRHVFAAPFGPVGPSPLTIQAIASYADQGTWFEQRGMACSDLSIDTPEEGGAQLQASGPSNYMKRLTSDPALTPAYETLAIKPFERGNLILTWLSGSAITQDFTVAVNNPVEPYGSLGIASKFFDVMEKANSGPIVVSGTIPKRLINGTDFDALVNATGFAGMAKWTNDSTIAATAYPYKLYLQMSNCQYTDGDVEALQNQRRHGASFNWKSTTPSTGSTTWTLVNATASYE
jgi:hypothetical protein